MQPLDRYTRYNFSVSCVMNDGQKKNKKVDMFAI